MASTSYTKSLTSDFILFDPCLFIEQIKASSIVPQIERIDVNGDDVVSWFDSALSPSEETDFHDLVVAHKLPLAKKNKISEIDTRTSELIASGFSFAGQQFSLAQTSQLNLLGMDLAKDDPAITYPIYYNTLSDDGSVALNNATDIHNFYLTALGTKRAYLDSGTGLKDAVRAAITVAEVDAVVDNR